MKIECPEETTSLPGAYKKSNCICKPGHHGDPRLGKCEICPADSYCPGGVAVNACPPLSSSEAGAYECTCDAGNYGNMEKGCKTCPAGSVCTGGESIQSCPERSTSKEGAKSVEDCTCNVGHFEPSADASTFGPDCVTCPVDHYCPGGSVAVPCPAHTVSPRLSEKEEQCTCAEGYFGADPGSCKICPKGFFCPGGAVHTPCPANSYSLEGATSMGQCTCVPGYVGSSADQCKPCPAGSFCEGGSHVQSCPEHSTSDEASSRCACAPGYQGADPMQCAVCKANSYCPGEGKQHKCPVNTVADAGRKKERECKCTRGYYGTGGDDCNVCPEGSYCPNNDGIPKLCPAHSTSKPFVIKAADCSCKAGFYNSRPLPLMGHLIGPECKLCPAGYFCGGDGRRQQCPARMHAPEGATSLSQCVCSAGYFGSNGKCEECPAGSYCQGGTEKRECPALSTGPKRAHSIDHCICDKGYYGTNPRECKRCPLNSYCPGGSAVNTCPQRAEAPIGSHVCTCRKGYYGSNPFHCQTCRRNYYCMGANLVIRCPKYSRSDLKAKSVNDCKCVAGYRRMTDDEGVMRCEKCPAGSYCEGNSVMRSCPSHMNSNPGARYKKNCGCMAGYYDGGVVPNSNFAWVYTGKVEIKIAGYYTFCITSDDGSRLFVDGAYKINNDGLHATRERCAGFTLSVGKHDVKCDGFQAGGAVSMWMKYRGPDTQNMNVLVKSVDKDGHGKAGWNLKVYRSNHFLRVMPDVKTLHYLGETTIDEINVPVQGGSGKFRGYITPECKKCVAGHYCPGAFPTRAHYPRAYLRRCPGYRYTSKTTAVTVHDCNECRPGYVGADIRSCRVCPRGSYCPGGNVQKECPAGSATIHYRRSNVDQCMCKPGFQRKEGGKPWECEPCSKGYYCPNYGGRHRRACPSGSTNTPGQISARSCMCAPGAYGGYGGHCYTCQSRYYCPGDGRRFYCHHRALSPRGSTSQSQCYCPNMNSQFPTVRKSMEPSSCQKYHCRTMSKCDMQNWCNSDKYCRGFTFQQGVMRGFGCKVRGLKSCLGSRKTSNVDFYEKSASAQMQDSVAMMRRMGLSVPECPKVGQPAVLFQHCWPRAFRGWQWKSVLYQGNYPYPHSSTCDNDEKLCKVSHCGLRGGDLSSMDIPSNMKVELYSAVNFGGSKITLYGPMNADHNCLTKFRINGWHSWNDRARSVKVLPK